MPTGILLYILIVVVKTIEVSMATVRIKLITKGQQLVGSIVGFFEIILWLLVVSSVLKDISSDPWKLIAYAVGFASGNYVGSILEERMGLGSVRIEVIVSETDGLKVTEALRSAGFAVTTIEGQGLEMKRKILLTMAKRKEADKVEGIVKSVTDHAFITLSDIKPVVGKIRKSK
ncbi:DUF2179 domain-containing protein [Guggenheimella bovis]